MGLKQLLPGSIRQRLKVARHRRELAGAARHGRAGVFGEIFRAARWGEGETRSGAGSTLAYTESLRQSLPVLLRELGVRRLLDAPCGDFNWFSHMPRDGYVYTGADIVAELVAHNQRRHGDERTRFQVLDICRDPLPAADLWLCRDCLMHLPLADALAVLGNFLASDIPWLLTTSHTDCRRNRDIPAGSFRQLNLQLPPFSLPQPGHSLEDWVAGFPRRVLGLWSREQVAGALHAAGQLS